MQNRFYLRLLLGSGLVLLLFTMYIAYSQYKHEWKIYQYDYKDLFYKKARDESARNMARAFDVKMQQIYLEGLNTVDRCTSCHLGVENPLMADAPVPFRTHSGDYLKNHSVERFGCTVCHHGQGRATNKKEAHGVGHEMHWGYPILEKEFVQTSCAMCHDLSMLKEKGGEKVVMGEKIFRQKGCRGCHKLEGVGGVLGKPLDGIGSQPVMYFPMKDVKGEKTVAQWLKEHFIDPRAVVPDSQMKVDLTSDEAALLTTYVMSLRSDEMPKKYRQLSGERIPDDIKDEGESLYKRFCVACHENGKVSNYFEPFKRTIPAIMNPAFLRAADDKFIKTVISEGRAGTQMTAWKAAAAGISDKQIDSIIKYITKDRTRERPAPFGFASYKGDEKRGENMFKIRCVSCHGESGEGGIGLNLRNPVVQNADPEFLAITVRDGREGTMMAAFGGKDIGLSKQDIVDIITYVKTLSKKKFKG